MSGSADAGDGDSDGDSDDHATRLERIVAALRDPETGCPWDRVQTLRSMAPYVVEEAFEVVESAETGQPGEVAEELGDLLFNVVFLGQLVGRSLDALARPIAEKMVRRHPHVFGDAAPDPRNWDADKAAARRAKGDDDPSALAGVSRALPALTRAATLQRRAARVGFDWSSLTPVVDKIAEELDEVRAELDRLGDAARAADDDASSPAEPDARLAAELGDLLFACVNLTRQVGVDAEQALRGANRRFESRFRRVEQLAGDAIRERSLAELEAFWQQAKREE